MKADSYGPGEQKPPDNKDSANKKLRKLKILLLIWLLSFIAAILYFTLSQGH